MAFGCITLTKVIIQNTRKIERSSLGEQKNGRFYVSNPAKLKEDVLYIQTLARYRCNDPFELDPAESKSTPKGKTKYPPTSELIDCKNTLDILLVMTRTAEGYNEVYREVKKRYNRLLVDVRKEHYKKRIDESDNETKCVWQIVSEIKGNPNRKKELKIPGDPNARFFFRETTNTTTLTTSTSTIGSNVPISTTAPTSLRVPAIYSLGIVATTLDNFSGKDAERYLKKLELRSKVDGWTEDETVKLLKFKLIGEAYSYLKSDTGLDSLSYYDLKNIFLKKFTPSKLPGESQWNLSRCFQRLDEEVSSFCTRLRIIGAKLLREHLSGATPEEEAGMRKKNKELLLNQFKIGLRKDLMEATGVLLLREENLDLETAENLVELQDFDSGNRRSLLHL
ncbi:hypothetical protein JTB14_013875 [Gonioctena quinquepunctata]|nr:hypothetical protein JTB14_013875 [Gonioctena quinquepunctata]